MRRIAMPIGPQVGICAVGISSVLSGQGSASAEVTQSQIMLGMALIVCSQVPRMPTYLKFHSGSIHCFIAAAVCFRMLCA